MLSSTVFHSAMEQVEDWQQRLRSRPYVTVEEAARLLGVGRGTSYTLVREGVLPTHRYGRLLRVPTQPLLALLLRDGDRDGNPAIGRRIR